MSTKVQKNVQLMELLVSLKKLSIEKNVKLWKRVAEDLEKSTRRRRIVNVYKINQYTKDNEIIIVPGKVLSVGDLDHKVTVAAYKFSDDAAQKINSSGKAISIAELMQSNPQAKNVRIIG